MRNNFWRNDDGAFAIIAALVMPVLLSAAILATEVGLWATRHQQMQGATDAAALAGVMSMTTGSALTIQGQALTAVSGFEHGVNGVTVQINSPPTSGAYKTRSDAVEAIVQKSYQPILAKFLSANLVNISSRSVAVPNVGACVLALDPSASGAIKLSGNGTVTLNGCNAMADSSSASAISAGGSSLMTLATAAAVGDITGRSNITTSAGFAPGAPYLDDPYAARSYPANLATPTNFPNGGTISPGAYKGTIHGPITMLPGIYYVDGPSFGMNGGGSIYGRGVTIVLTGNAAGNIINGNSTIDLTAPASGPTAGIVLFGDRSVAHTTFKINGGSAQSWGGAIYLPNTDLTFVGGAAGTTGCMQMIAKTVEFSGNSNMSLNCAGTGVEMLATKRAVLVE